MSDRPSKRKPFNPDDYDWQAADGAADRRRRLKPNAVIERLAALSPFDYDDQRKAEAKVLGIRPSTLDKIVAKARVEGNIDFRQGQQLRLSRP